MNLYLLIIVAVVSFFIGRSTKKTFIPMDKEGMHEIGIEARKALERRTEERKEKILEFMKKEAEHLGELQLCGVDTNRKEFDREDVEKLLDVSDTTALKYLDELEAEGKIVQVGNVGRDVHYTLKNY